MGTCFINGGVTAKINYKITIFRKPCQIARESQVVIRIIAKQRGFYVHTQAKMNRTN